MDVSYDVKVWKLWMRTRGKKRRYVVRWTVDGRQFTKTYDTKAMGDSHRSHLIAEKRNGAPFSTADGQPIRSGNPAGGKTWLDLAMEYVDRRWDQVSPNHRRDIAEGLATATVALSTTKYSRAEVARNALRKWAFNTEARKQAMPEEFVDAMRWARESSPALSAIQTADYNDLVHKLGLRLDGTPAAPSTYRRKRSAVNNALEFAIQRGYLDSNPLTRHRSKQKPSTQVVEIVSPSEARELLLMVEILDPALTAFFACIYHAGMRPGEVRGLRKSDLTLPLNGWGKARLRESLQDVGKAWTDGGARVENRGLKHRARGDSRPVPLHPTLVKYLRDHLNNFACGPDGHLFVTRVRNGHPVAGGSPLNEKRVYSAWHHARAAVLTFDQLDQGYMARPYDLRHAALSTWLAAGVPAAQVSQWAGNSIAVLLSTYAKVIADSEQRSLDLIENYLTDQKQRDDINLD